jgi:hypothetical protein
MVINITQTVLIVITSHWSVMDAIIELYYTGLAGFGTMCYDLLSRLGYVYFDSTISNALPMPL